MARNDPAVGIWLGDGAVRAVALSASTLEPVGVSEGTPGASQAESLRSALRSLHVRPTAVATGFGLQRATVRRMQLPQTSSQNLDRLVRMEAERYIPLPLDAVELDFQAERDRTADRVDVVVVAVRKEDAAQLGSALTEATNAPTVLDSDGTALLAAWDAKHPGDSNPVLLVDLSGTDASLVVCESGMLALARSAPVGVDALRAALAEDLRVSLAEAEEVRTARGVVGLDAGPPDLTAAQDESACPAASAWLATLAQEVRRTLESFRGHRGGVGRCDVVLTGEGADTPGLVEAIEQAAGEAVDIFDPLAGCHVALPGAGHSFTLAYGYALRAARRSPVLIDLSPRHQRAVRRRREKATGGLAVAAILTVVLLAAYIYANNRLEQAEGELSRLQADAAALQSQVGDLETAMADAAAVTDVEEVLAGLEAPEAQPLDILEDVSLSLPGGVWLTDFFYDQDRGVSLKGSALDAASITEAVRGLSRKPYLATVKLSGIAIVQIGDREVYEFEITGDFEKPEETESQ